MSDNIDDIVNDILTTTSDNKKGKSKRRRNNAKKAEEPIVDIEDNNKESIIIEDNNNKITKEEPKTQEIKQEENKDENNQKDDEDNTIQETNANNTEKKKKVVVKKVVKKGAKSKKEDAFLKLAQERVKLNKELEEQARKEAEEQERLRKEEEERLRKEEEERLRILAQEEEEKKKLDEERKKLGLSQKQYAEMKKKQQETLSKLGGQSLSDILHAQVNKPNKKKKHIVKKKEEEKQDVSNNQDDNNNKTNYNNNEIKINENKDDDDVMDNWEDEMEMDINDNNNNQNNKDIYKENEEITVNKVDIKENTNKEVDNDNEENEEEKRLRKPIICVLGHVDTGKTKILDKIRKTNVQLGEAGGITQQIGATDFPLENINKYLKNISDNLKLNPCKVPGFIIIDTPGHASFQNLRSRGQSLCDLAVVVIDIMHGLELQTIDSLKMLKHRKTPFLIALNKIDRLFGWKSIEWESFRETLKQQPEYTVHEFNNRLEKIQAQIVKEVGFNTALFDENINFKEYVNIVPTSAISGEGIPDLMNMYLYLGQKYLHNKIKMKKKVQCSVLEVKVLEGVGTTIDVLLVNGTLKIGDKFVIAGDHGPIKSQIKYIMTPHPMKDIRIKSEFDYHNSIEGAIGLKIFGKDLERALAGSPLNLYKTEKECIELCKEVEEECTSVKTRYLNKNGKGVLVTASSLGALEAVLSFLDQEDKKEPKVDILAVSLGYIQKKDVTKITTLHIKEKEKNKVIKKEELVVLGFDVTVSKEVQEFADKNGVTIITADTIYHLKTKFLEFKEKCFEERKKEKMKEAIFPCELKIVPKGIFHKYDPVIVGVEVQAGILKIGTPLYCFEKKKVLGTVEGIEKNGKHSNDITKKDGGVAIRIKGIHSNVAHKSHFDEENTLYSNLSRLSIDRFKEFFYNDLVENSDYVDLIKKIKTILDIK